MKMKHPITLVLAGLLAVSLLWAATAEADVGRSRSVKATDGVVAQDGYTPETTTVPYRTGLTALDVTEFLPTTPHDGTTDASVATIETIVVTGYANLRLSARFSAASANVQVTVLRCRWTGVKNDNTAASLAVKDQTELTLTASAGGTLSGKYMSIASFTVDTAGCQVMKVLIRGTGVSSGSADLFVEVM